MSFRSRIGLVTCEADKLRDYYPTSAEPGLVPTELPFTPDDQILVNELRRAGHEVRAVVWGGAVADLVESVDLLLIRSPWDYMYSAASRKRFVDWIVELDQAGLAVENHPRLMTWLMDKRYLKDLEAVGVAIVPTRVVPADEPAHIAEAYRELGPLIAKPCVSAAGVGLVHVTSNEQASRLEDEWQAANERQWYLLQPFIPQIQTAGEWSLVYLGGQYSHAVHKLPGAGSILVHAEQGGSLRFADPPDVVRATADYLLARLAKGFQRYSDRSVALPPLYMRVDVIESGDGPLISECEGVEPELFFRARPGSERRLRELLEERMRLPEKS